MAEQPEPRARGRAPGGALLAASGVGALAGALLGIVLILGPGPLTTGSPSGAIGRTVALAAAGALASVVVAALLSPAREEAPRDHEDPGR